MNYSSWKEFLEDEKKEEYYRKLKTFLDGQYATKTIFPPKEEIFNAFRYTRLENVKVVIIGQDPYHEENQACGLAFAVKPGVKMPPSLVNIYKEIENDLHVKMSNNGFLGKWASQGVLLLNAVLSVEQGKANSHRDIGWQTFTNHVIECLNNQDRPIVFLLWGANAKKKMELLNNPKHLVLTAAHPSPLSAYNGFFGCRHFSKTNNYLIQNGLSPIDWRN